MTSPSVKSVLYVEDDENDTFFLEKAWKALGVSSPLEIARDGKEAIDYLSAKTTQARSLSLILLDLNLPRLPGLYVLNWIRQQTHLRTLPVLILTSSHHARDVHTAYRLGANAYLLKPPQVKDLTSLAKGICDFWLQRNLPPPDPSEFQ